MTNPTHPAADMTKREFFAAAAMQAILSNPVVLERLDGEPAASKCISQDAVVTADALIAELNRGEKPEEAK